MMLQIQSRQLQHPQFLLLSVGILILLGGLVGPTPIVGAADNNNLISNPDFLGVDGLVPIDWSIFQGRFNQQLFVLKETDDEGILLIDDQSSEAGYGLRSNPVRVEDGLVYKATVTGRTEDGGNAVMYLDFWDENRKRIRARTVGVNSDDWQTVSTSLEAPEGAVWVTVILYSNISTVGKSYFKDVILETVNE